MSMFTASVPRLNQMLANLDSWLSQAAAYAEERGFDPEILVQARLYPDQFALVRQVQSACDTAKFIAARLGGHEAPVHPDDETKLAELHARIASTRAFLDEVSESDFAGAKDRRISLPGLPGKVMTGPEYLNGFALPNFYFHATTAYAILRHNGVPLGKRTFIGHLDLKDG